MFLPGFKSLLVSCQGMRVFFLTHVQEGKLLVSARLLARVGTIIFEQTTQKDSCECFPWTPHTQKHWMGCLCLLEQSPRPTTSARSVGVLCTQLPQGKRSPVLHRWFYPNGRREGGIVLVSLSRRKYQKSHRMRKTHHRRVSSCLDSQFNRVSAGTLQFPSPSLTPLGQALSKHSLLLEGCFGLP